MQQPIYNKIAKENVNGEIIEYGIVYGNEKIVFIKAGYLGNIQGYEDKYLKIAHRLHNRLGATVICASNPDADYDAQVAADKVMIEQVAAEAGFSEYQVYLLGTSDGGYQNLLMAQAVPQTVKFLGINPSQISFSDLTKRLQSLAHVKKHLVYGTKDELYQYVPSLQALECANLEILTVEGADHEFTGRVEEFIALTDLI